MRKHCNTCCITKDGNEFHKRKASGDGLAAKCKECAKAYDASRLKAPHRVKLRKEYAKTSRGIERGNAAKIAWDKRNPKKKKASSWLANAIRDGKITKQPCEICGSTYRIHGHHDDYDKIYDVRWLCAQHHRDWHREHGEALNPR